MKIAFKNFLMTLKRYKVASLLNVVGLTLAFVAFYIIASQVYYTLTFNRSIKDADRTYILSPNFGNDPNDISWSTNSPGMAAYDAIAKTPEVEAAFSISPSQLPIRIWVKRNDLDYDKYTEEIKRATPNTPEVAGFKCIAGDFSKLKEPNTVIMAESTAELMGLGIGDNIYHEGGHWFNDGKPAHELTIVAIYEDMPKNCLFGSWKIIRGDEGVYTTENNNWNYCTFVRLREGADTKNFIHNFQDSYAQWFLGMVEEWIIDDPEEEEWVKEEIENGRHILATRLVRIDDMYYHGHFSDAIGATFESGNASAPVILTTIALVIVIIAFINFVNFFFALVPVRMRSVNICKVFGASQGTLRWNFLFEAIGLVLIAMALTFYLMVAIQESFITNYVTCSLALGDNIPVITMMVGLMILLALVAALYPAFYITRFNASLGVKGGFAQSVAGRRLRSIMVGIQFTVAMILIIATSVFFLQYRYMVKYDLGFEKENIVNFGSNDLYNHTETVIERLLQYPDVVDATSSYFNIFGVGQTTSIEKDGKQAMLHVNFVRHNFVDFFGFEIVDGKNFTPSSGERGEVIVFSSLAKDINWGIGETVYEREIVGLINDVQFGAVNNPDEYHALVCREDEFGHNNFYVRLRAGADIAAFNKYLEQIVKVIAPMSEFPGTYFLDTWIEWQYRETKKVMILVGMFAVLAIVIALMGVFGIVMFETQHRRSEIAVRKVYGATTRQIVEMLNMRYVWIVVGCFVVAAPVAWYITSSWLESFANRIAQPWWLYIAALAVVLAVTVGLVTLRSWKAATENPADVVKSN